MEHSKLTRNSAKCNHCGVEIESKHRHDFAVHYCKVKPVMHDTGETWLFAVDGGLSYTRRAGDFSSMTETSTYEHQPAV